MRKFYFTLLLLTLFSIARAQSWAWAIHENVTKFAVDSSGNIFSYNDSTIKRFNSKGILQWKKQFRGDLLIEDMVADNAGNLYITGVFTKFSIETFHFNSRGHRDIFFGKINSGGTLLWKKTFGGPNDDYVTDLYLDKKNKILICGNAGIGCVIEGKTFFDKDFFSARYELNGKSELLISHSGGYVWEISADSNGNIYQLGGIRIADTLSFGKGIFLIGCTADCMGTHFIAKYNAKGEILWAKDLGNDYYKPFKHLGIGNKGDFYLTKWGRYSGFSLSKFDAAGNLVWTNNISGTYGDCNSINIDNNDAIWLVGDIWNGGFNGQPFIWEFNPANNLIQSTRATISATGNNIGNDHANNIYISGSFNDTAIFGNTTLLDSKGNNFLAKINRKPNVVHPQKINSKNQKTKE